MKPAGKHQTAALAAFWQGDDSSSEGCNATICLIQGESTTVTRTFPCDYLGVCPDSHQWVLKNMPAGVEYEILNHSHDSISDTITQIKLRADPDAVNRDTYLDPVVEMSPAAGWGEQFHIQVLCSLKRGQCGRGEIVDAQDTSHVVDNDTVRIGRPVRPLPRPVAFSAGPFYTSMNIQNVDWAFDTSAVIESEDLWWERERSASHWYPLMPSALENNELHFHFWRTGSYPVSATFEIHRNTIGVHVPWTENINYTAIGPTSATSLHWFAVGDGKFAWDTQHNILKYYLEGVNDGGMNYDFVAADPNNAGGHVAGTQLAKSHRKAWYLGGNVWTGGTNNEWLLDGCTLYDTARGAAGAFHWQSRDSPGQGLLEVLDSVFIADTFRMYFMYRPRGRSASDSTSIWVPLQKLTWWYNAKLINDSASVLKHWWSVSGSVSKGSDTSTTKEFPEWNGIEPSGDCPPIPAP